jgi:hypothetical protein
VRRSIGRLLQMVPREDVGRLHEAHLEHTREIAHKRWGEGLRFGGYATFAALSDEGCEVEAEAGRAVYLWGHAPAARHLETGLALDRIIDRLRMVVPLADWPQDEDGAEVPAIERRTHVDRSGARVTLTVPVHGPEAAALLADLRHEIRLGLLRDGLGLRGAELRARLDISECPGTGPLG